MPVLFSGELQTETYNGETITYVKASDFYDLTSSTPEQEMTPEPSSQASETVMPASERTAMHAENGFSQEQPLNQQGLAPAQNEPQQQPFEMTPKVTVTQIDPVAQTATAFYQKDGSRQTRHMSVSKLLVLQSQLDHGQDGTVELTEQQFESDQM